MPGRGAWLCAGSPSCIDQAERRNAFSRSLRGTVEASAIEPLRASLVRLEVWEDAPPVPITDEQ